MWQAVFAAFIEEITCIYWSCKETVYVQETVHLFLENWHGSGDIEFLLIGNDIYVLMLVVQMKVLGDKTPMMIYDDLHVDHTQ